MSALNQDYQKGFKEFAEAFNAAKDDEERESITRKQLPIGAYKMVLGLVRKQPKDEAVLDALSWLVVYGRGGSEAEDAAEIIVKDHLGNENLRGLCMNVVGPIPSLTAETLLRDLTEKSKHDSVRGAACFALAQVLERQVQLHDGLEKTPALKFNLEAFCGRFFVFHVAELDVAKTREEIAELYGRIETKYKDDKELLAVATEKLFEVRTLAIGKRAPEIVGRDADGKTFKLGDYRKKIVVLVFWTDGDPNVETLLTDLGALDARLEDQPFAILGVHVGDKELYRKAASKYDITWRNWLDGLEAPIMLSWKLQQMPDFYLLNESGVIEAKHLSFAALDQEVDRLLEKLTGKAPPKAVEEEPDSEK